MFKLVLEKAEEPEIKLPTSTGSWKKPVNLRQRIKIREKLKMAGSILILISSKLPFIIFVFKFY